MRVDPEGAYRYAFGEPIELPLGDDFTARQVQIDRPLDFAGVTDHAEFFGEQSVCMDPASAGYRSSFCEVMRSGDNPTVFGDGLQTRDFVFVKDIVQANLLAMERSEAEVPEAPETQSPQRIYINDKKHKRIERIERIEQYRYRGIDHIDRYRA